jgi:hypothetical protein
MDIFGRQGAGIVVKTGGEGGEAAGILIFGGKLSWGPLNFE